MKTSESQCAKDAGKAADGILKFYREMMEQRKKKKLRITVPCDARLELDSFEGEIDDVIRKLSILSQKYKLQPDYKLHISTDKEYEYYSNDTSCSVSVSLTLTREQTNREIELAAELAAAEKQKQKVKNAAQRKAKLDADRATYEKLKKKFGDA